MTNNEIRQAITTSHIKYWEVADALGIHENTLFRMMRHELPEDKQKQIMSIIKTISRKEH